MKGEIAESQDSGLNLAAALKLQITSLQNVSILY